ncbi:LysR family transcriptional regulator [Amorphus sp. 3PC139-8]|uniref:LysR family transcriptional regulator n=1 Tax=Amorphus sp. 3PC139-8 TaxID=2735676 RepID=UPI00345D05A6
MNVTLRQLRAFFEVAQARSFTVAARKMNLTQSAVSMLVRQLETEYGMPLFDRAQREVKLTEIGRQMLPVTTRILEDLKQVYDSAEDLKALKRGKVRLAVSQVFACSLLPSLASEFAELYPDISLQVMDTTGDRIMPAVQDNEAEIGIGPERPMPAGIDAELLWREPIRIVVPQHSDLARAETLSWSDLRQYNWIQYSDDFTLYLERSIWTSLPFAPVRQTRVRYLTTALAFVGQGMGITAAPGYARIFEDQFSVKFVAVTGEQIVRRFFLFRRTGHSLSPPVASFISMVQARLTQSHEIPQTDQM